MRLLILLFCTVSLTATAAETTSASAASSASNDAVCVKFTTSVGNLTARLYSRQSPITVTNFLHYVDSGFYDNTLFHRVIANFMIQTGGFDRHGNKKRTRAAIKNESSNGLSNLRGTLAMARRTNPNSASSQFYINVADNASLDYRPGHPGYAVFGTIIDGMGVADSISTTPTGVRSLNGYGTANVPTNPITIKTATRTQCQAS